MGKYDPLHEFLLGSSDCVRELNFTEIEEILSNPLPPSARRHQAWWANETHGSHSHARSWQDAGWETSKVNLADETVRFERRRSTPSKGQPKPRAPGLGPDLWESAMAVTGITDRDELIETALVSLLRREAGRRLAALGGTMPDIQAPPRRRFS